MAHPLTLPFPSAPRPSPLAFGFGLPSGASPAACGTPPRSPSYNPMAHTPLGFGFASTPSASPKKAPRPGISPSPSAYRTSTATSLKRTRRSPSPASSSLSSPNGSPQPSSPTEASTELPKPDQLSVGGLLLKDDGRRPRKEVKRFRKDASAPVAASGSSPNVDVGVLLGKSHLSPLSPRAHASCAPVFFTPVHSHERLDCAPESQS